jgi:hypothetical protein
MSYKVIVNFGGSNAVGFSGRGDAIMCTCGMKKVWKEVALLLLSLPLSLPLSLSFSRFPL